ncbi:hypothetical protein OIU74_023060 [Salix koriyanagi]|uniref:Uncharacterized protein n=1 Tax=Salix koriyanagi TaxID=2511006 RepID=A0A9Q0WBA7_9ROSI|nr:hypothetical protein OIU74_023060 [Salix koriyanagi]
MICRRVCFRCGISTECEFWGLWSGWWGLVLVLGLRFFKMRPWSVWWGWSDASCPPFVPSHFLFWGRCFFGLLGFVGGRCFFSACFFKLRFWGHGFFWARSMPTLWGIKFRALAEGSLQFATEGFGFSGLGFSKITVKRLRSSGLGFLKFAARGFGYLGCGIFGECGGSSFLLGSFLFMPGGLGLR